MGIYKKAGVDIKKKYFILDWLKKQSGTLSKIPEGNEWAFSVDGVGTKLKLAFLLNKQDTIGIDLVAMVANDLLTLNAKPAYFLDYLAIEKLHIQIVKKIFKGILIGCNEAGFKLIGGETAEMPGFYKKGEYDLAGFGIGKIIKKSEKDLIIPGDLIFGFPSSGIHSNGFSLIRKIFSKEELKKLGNILLKPTRIYVKDILPLLENPSFKIKAIVHITGGGLSGRLERVLPDGLIPVLNKNMWNIPDIFKHIAKKGNVTEIEMFKIFNMGIGMALITNSTSPPIEGTLHIGEIKKK